MPRQRRIYRLVNIRSWSDRKITFVLAGLFLLGLLLVVVPPVLLSIEFVVKRGEEIASRTDVNRALALLENKIDQLDTYLYDYSAWDATYQYLEDRDPAYITTNLSPEVLAKMGIQHILILDRAGKLVFSGSLEAGSERFQPLAFEPAALLDRYPQLTHHDEPDSSRAGYTAVNGQVMAVASRPVITSRYTGAAQGTMILLMDLNEGQMEILSSLAQRSMRILPAEQAPALAASGAALAGDSAVSVRALDRSWLAGYQVLPDFSGRPAGVLEVRSPRYLLLLGNITTVLFVLIMVGLAAALFVTARPLVLNFARADRAGKEYLERFQAVVQQSGEAILLLAEEGRILDLNLASKRLLGLDEERTVPLYLSALLSFDPGFHAEFLQEITASGETVEKRCTRRDGKVFDLEIRASKIHYLSSIAYSILLRDITERKATEQDLRASQERYQLATRGANDGIWDWNLMTNQVYYSSRWKAMLGCRREEIDDTFDAWLSRIHPEDRLSFQSAVSEHLNQQSSHLQCEVRMQHASGQYRWMLVRGVAIWAVEGYAHRMAGSLTDITHQKDIENQLRHDALHDPLTGLGNRTLLIDRVHHANERKKRRPTLQFAVFFLDFNRFKQINDLLGHQAGDQVLIEAARRLETRLRAVDTISRFGGLETLVRIAGDEFVLLLEDVRSAEDALRVGERIKETLEGPYWIAGREINVTVSMGVVIPEQPYLNAEDLIRDADIAMYHAKQRGGRQIVHFAPEMYRDTLNRLELESELREAIERGEFVVYYQPIHSLNDERLVGFEALVRWNHPRRGLLAPGAFLEVAEESGMIIPLGYTVLSQACRQMSAWKKTCPWAADLTISVNLSTKQAANNDLVSRVTAVLSETGLEPGKLWLEVTEHTLMENVQAVQSQLQALRKLGIMIEIDDFGTGYSSLSYLKNLPVDGFKIDRSFIGDMDKNGERIVETLVMLGHNLGLSQVAEGVETELQKTYLKSLSCDYMQGFLIARPMDAREIEAYVEKVNRS